MYEGFERFEIRTSDPEVKIVGRGGGSGPALLLLYGNPLTHLSWSRIAPRLMRDFTAGATERAGSEGYTTSTSGMVPTRLTGAKSRTGS